MKETFILRTEWYDAIKELSDIEQAVIFRNLFEYHSGNDVNTSSFTLPVKLVWSLIEPNLKRNIIYYDKRSETSANNGRLGGRPPLKNNLNNLTEKPNKPIETLSVSVSVSDSDTDNDTVKEEFDFFWNLYDKKVGEKKALLVKWGKLKKEDKEKILLHVPKYKAAQPDKRFRKNHEAYLNQKAWNDEIINSGKILIDKPIRPIRQEDYFEYRQYLADCEKYNITPQPPL